MYPFITAKVLNLLKSYAKIRSDPDQLTSALSKDWDKGSFPMKVISPLGEIEKSITPESIESPSQDSSSVGIIL